MKTLILCVTKGLDRYKVVIAKIVVLTLLWTAGYWLCLGITYGYNAYYWDNSAAHHLMFSAVCWWSFGFWIVSLLIFFSTILNTNASVLVSTGGIVFVLYLIGILPKAGKYLPTALLNGNLLINGAIDAKTYLLPLISTLLLSMFFFIVSIPIFNKKQL